MHMCMYVCTHIYIYIYIYIIRSYMLSFLNNLTNRQTDRQTDTHTHAHTHTDTHADNRLSTCFRNLRKTKTHVWVVRPSKSASQSVVNNGKHVPRRVCRHLFETMVTTRCFRLHIPNTLYLTCGLDYTFTNYNFKNTLEVHKQPSKQPLWQGIVSTTLAAAAATTTTITMCCFIKRT